MYLGERGQATMELLLLIPLILIVLALIWISSEFVYVKQRTLLASRCLALHERDSYYAYLKSVRKVKEDDRPSYSYRGKPVLHSIFFPDKKEDNYYVQPIGASMGKDASGQDHTPKEAPKDFDKGAWGFIVKTVNKARGATNAVVEIKYKPVLFWPKPSQNICDTTYLAASDWRYDELPDGYIGLLRKKLEEIGKSVGCETCGEAVGKILKWVLD